MNISTQISVHSRFGPNSWLDDEGNAVDTSALPGWTEADEPSTGDSLVVNLQTGVFSTIPSGTGNPALVAVFAPITTTTPTIIVTAPGPGDTTPSGCLPSYVLRGDYCVE